MGSSTSSSPVANTLKTVVAGGFASSAAVANGAAAPVAAPLGLLAVATGCSSLSSTSSSDQNVVDALKQQTDALVASWRNRTFNVQHIEIWTRAAQGSSAAVADAAIGGVCHTFLLIETGPTTFLLERLVEGIRFVALNDTQVAANKKWAACMVRETNVSLSSRNIAQWIEGKQTSLYNLMMNNCIHFCFQFGVHFRFNGRLFQSAINIAEFFQRAQAQAPQRPSSPSAADSDSDST